MASESAADAGAPNLNLTPDEKRVYGQLFRQADTDNVGVVTGEVAVKFFDKTRLDSRILGEIWQIADKENRGFLTPAGFGIVLRLIGHAQAGREPTPELALQPAPIPRFDGFTPAPAPLSAQTTGSGPPGPIQAQGTGGLIRIPPLTPEKVAQYNGLFERQTLGPGNLLPGDQAKSIFEKSGLPNEILGRIWQLADTEQRGALVMTEFVIAMHLLTSMKTGTLRALPNILPAALYEAATRRGPPGGPRQQSPTHTGPPVPAIPRQLSGQAQMRTGSPLGRPPLGPQSTGEWLVTPAEKARCDQLFEELDKSKKGFISGEEAVPFLSQSGLPEDALAQIWDLADFKSEGRLNRDTFAVAMYLIRQQRNKRDGPVPLPASLAPNLIPPSMRSQVRPPTATASAFEPPAQPPPVPAPQPKSALDDLFGLDSAPLSPTLPAQTAMTTGGSTGAADPFAGGPSSPAKASPSTSTFKPFVPSSSFGRTLTSHATGDSSGSAPAAPKSVSQAAFGQDDLLGDDGGDASKSLNNDSTELANLSNQIGSLSKHMQEVQTQRASTQNELNQTTQQKKNFEQRLSQLRALYEKEAKDVRALEEQLNTARSETRKIQTEMMTLDGTYQDLQTQHAQVSAALQADQQENANLKERIRTVNAEIAQIKPQIEKLKSEARQQKGLVAINKKQLSTNEAERDRLKHEAEDLAKSNEELSRQVSAGSPSNTPAPVTSPALSASGANNPFFRRTGSTDIMGAFASPPAKAFNDKSFDDVFGPSPPAASQGSASPVASFKPQHTGASTASAGSFATPATGGTPTVSRQATLHAEQPPPPPASRQMSSSFLPFADTSESLTSSRQVSPPGSRVGPVENTPLPLEPTATGQSAASASLSATNEPATKPTGAEETHLDSAVNKDEPKASPFGHAHSDSVGDPFAVADQAKAKQDFESAFASFKSSRGKPEEASSNKNAAPAAPFAAFNTEFPPISELERDDESDSDSDKGGFDDDFAPASPKGAEKKAESPTLTKATVADEAETPVPSAEGSEAKAAVATDKSVAPPAVSAANTAPASHADVDDPFGASSDAPVAKKPEITKAPFDDLDDDFEGLEDAKEGSADDDFANISRSGLDDFNPVFDSSPPSSRIHKTDTGLTSTSGAFGTDSGFDFGNLGASTASVTAPSAQNGAPAGPTTAAAGGKAPTPPDAQDWDAIFASLDEPGTAAAAPADESPAAAATAAANRPALDRTATAESEHDDPILKNLTSMGYSRSESLSALEKYDYNLERAANYLASQS